ncbi:cystatin-POGU1-like [Cotesia glomerata]|uniref:Cystatin domain-containing protein n=1 Tax=Cotesia glomerata TaxID=32391 RepID=A0AAV7HYX8_COTGL|nr:cystatin-POGU1-like [Cotesia glomerata]KAH0550263.1 hypothetical protein KQX54_018474 [Cotesia glomerata]
MHNQYRIFKIILVCLIFAIIATEAKRSVPGAPQSIPIDSPEIQEYTKKGLKQFSATYEGAKEPVVAEIVSASRQTVAGSLYKIKVRFGESSCPKGQFTETCLLVEESPTKDCEIKIWERPWIQENPLEITIKCE